jgi:thioredoxin-dependent peroxiredoxin
MLKKGDIAPDFALEDDAGKTVTLDSLLDAGPAIVYFYPADFSLVCTAEACSIRDMHDEILEADLRVVGISSQSAQSHKRFKQANKLPFPLLYDEGRKVIRAYGVEGPFGIGARRVTYLIGQDKVIQNLVVADLLVGSHVKFIRGIIDQATGD